ncbi:MAG: xanthine dehydrogenase family protein subunit M, partial [Acetobacteraceae bacterium]|nr:xanthine dehydrogenase family protein subunit M [Acetobacteraceae bacterium]
QQSSWAFAVIEVFHLIALAALGGAVRAVGPAGERAIEIGAFFLEPGATPWLEVELWPDELITGVDVALPGPARRSVYLKVRDRASYEFALASAAVGLEQEGARILNARVALGGVATRPWRCESAERALVGRGAGPAAFGEAAEAALAGATPGRENGFKIELARRTLVRALTQASELPA